MRSPVPDYLQEIIDDLATDTSGAVAGYIPELADADPDVLGIALTTVDGRTHSAGDDAIEFSIQSISKPFTYAAALTDRGFDEVAGTVGVEPSGEAFNELSLEGGSCRPRNPMINAGAGEWLTQVGIPAKSGVAGGLLGALPGQCGIAVMSPRLDDHGNSVRGVRAFRRMSDDMGMHLFESESYGSTVLREITVVDDATRVTLRGTVQFSGAEVILDALAADTTGTPRVILDVSGVDHVTDVGRRMLLEGLRRISLDGRSPALYDPESILPEPDLGDGSLPELVREL